MDSHQTTIGVVVCCHDAKQIGQVKACLNSLDVQAESAEEIVVVVDGDRELYDWLTGVQTIDKLLYNETNRGLLVSRNRGAAAASTDVVAFIDADAEASPWWLAELRRLYDERDAIAAGGKLVADWQSARPWHLPHEYDWLVGATHRGFAPEHVTEVRNTFGSNLSFRADVFEALGGFETAMVGRSGNGQFQGGETELCCRLQAEYGRGVTYSPEAVVYHHVPDSRTGLRPCLHRAYYQGRSKAGMNGTEVGDLGAEHDFLTAVMRGMADRAARLVTLPIYTAAVAVGYARETVGGARMPEPEPSTEPEVVADGIGCVEAWEWADERR